MHGSLSQESLCSVFETLDYTRCQRPDGSHYGTSGKCRKGKQVGANTHTGPKGPVLPKLKAQAAKENPQAIYKKLADERLNLLRQGKIKEADEITAKVEEAFRGWSADSNEDQALKEYVRKSTEEGFKRERTLSRVVQRQRAALPVLSKVDIKAIQDYTDEGGNRSFGDLNRCLRRPLCLSLERRKHAAELDKALMKIPRNDEGNAFYRGITIESSAGEALYRRLQRSKPGDKIRDPGFSSFSLDKAISERFTREVNGEDWKNILFVCKNKELRSISEFSQFPEEQEAILPRGIPLTIRRVTRTGKTLIVEVN